MCVCVKKIVHFLPGALLKIRAVFCLVQHPKTNDPLRHNARTLATTASGAASGQSPSATSAFDASSQPTTPQYPARPSWKPTEYRPASSSAWRGPSNGRRHGAAPSDASATTAPSITEPSEAAGPNVLRERGHPRWGATQAAANDGGPHASAATASTRHERWPAAAPAATTSVWPDAPAVGGRWKATVRDGWHGTSRRREANAAAAATAAPTAGFRTSFSCDGPTGTSTDTRGVRGDPGRHEDTPHTFEYGP